MESKAQPALRLKNLFFFFFFFCLVKLLYLTPEVEIVHVSVNIGEYRGGGVNRICGELKNVLIV